jgi:hypothetical protein
MRLSYTNPITGQRISRDTGRMYTEIDQVVLEIEHTYRSKGLWTASLCTERIAYQPLIEWTEGDGQVFIFASTRRELAERIAEYVTTQEWREKRSAWLHLVALTKR